MNDRRERATRLEDEALGAVLEPVFLEPRDAWWLVHRPGDLGPAQQQAFHLVPRATAEQLPSISYCEDCFPAREE